MTPATKTRTVAFKKSSLPNVIKVWNNFNIRLHDSPSFMNFKNIMLETSRP